MKNLTKSLAIILATMFVCLQLSPLAFAADDGTNPETEKGTVLPETELSMDLCQKLMYELNSAPSKFKEAFKNEEDVDDYSLSDVLGCAIKTGDIKLWMVPYFIRYFLEFLIGLAGLVSVGGLVYGGYLYLFAGLSDDKEKGKKAIMYSVAGLVMTMLAWALVNIVIAFVTG